MLRETILYIRVIPDKKERVPSGITPTVITRAVAGYTMIENDIKALVMRYRHNQNFATEPADESFCNPDEITPAGNVILKGGFLLPYSGRYCTVISSPVCYRRVTSLIIWLFM